MNWMQPMVSQPYPIEKYKPNMVGSTSPMPKTQFTEKRFDLSPLAAFKSAFDTGVTNFSARSKNSYQNSLQNFYRSQSPYENLNRGTYTTNQDLYGTSYMQQGGIADLDKQYNDYQNFAFVAQQEGDSDFVNEYLQPKMSRIESERKSLEQYLNEQHLQEELAAIRKSIPQQQQDYIDPYQGVQVRHHDYNDNSDEESEYSSSFGIPSPNVGFDPVKNYLTQKGLKRHAVAGVMGNIEHESSFNPGAVGDNGSSYGLFQHHKERKNNLLDFLSKRKLPANSIQGQIDFALSERPDIVNKINNARSPQEAADIWVREFEKPANVNQQSQLRQKAALKYYQSGGSIQSLDQFKNMLKNPRMFLSENNVDVPIQQIELAKQEMLKQGIPNFQKQAYVKGKSERAFNNITPQGYGDLSMNLDRYARYKSNSGRNINDRLWYGKGQELENGKKAKENVYYNIPKRDDAFRLYLGLPQKNNSFGVSDYRPSRSTDKNTVYLKPNYWSDSMKQSFIDDFFSPRHKDNPEKVFNERGSLFKYKRDSLKKANIPWDNPVSAEWFADNPLGDFTATQGIDRNGEYISIYDKWDLNPFSTGDGASSNKEASASLINYLKKFGKNVTENTEISEIFNAGKPYEIYDRLYYNKNKKLINAKQLGGIITDPMGQYNHPGEITNIPSNNITMQGIPYPVLGISNTGDSKLMQPNMNYKFKGKSVLEIPIFQKGGSKQGYVFDPSRMQAPPSFNGMTQTTYGITPVPAPVRQVPKVPAKQVIQPIQKQKTFVPMQPVIYPQAHSTYQEVTPVPNPFYVANEDFVLPQMSQTQFARTLSNINEKQQSRQNDFWMNPYLNYITSPNPLFNPLIKNLSRKDQILARLIQPKRKSNKLF